jgi:P27 family predicted phage terminase small subunit
MPGPAAKPTRLQKLAGNPGKRALKREGAQPEILLGYAPKHLPEEGRAEWNRIAGELRRLGLLTVVDRGMFAGYCQAWADYLEAEAELQRSGRVLVTEKGYQYQSPWIGIKKLALLQLYRFGSEFGFSPRSRRTLDMEAEGEQSLADILFGGVEEEEQGE